MSNPIVTGVSRVVCNLFDKCPAASCFHKLPHDPTKPCGWNVGCALDPTARCLDFMFKKDEAEGRKVKD